MTTFGRVVIGIVAAAVLVGGVWVAVHYLKRPDDSASPKVPVVVETPPSSGESAPPVAPTPATPPASATAPTAPSSAAAPSAPPTGTVNATATGVPAIGAGVGPVPAGPGAAAAEEGLAMIRDRPFQAQKRLSEALRAGIDGAKGKEVRDALIALADKVQLSTQRVSDDTYGKTYQVAPGDSLIAIGKRHLVPAELIMRVNRMGGTNIMAGQQIKVIQGPIHIEIVKGRRELHAWLGDVCLRIYPIAIGASNKTPDGTFIVKSKMKNPPYQPQHKTKAEFKVGGAPDNPLGSRWIDIGNHYGIHGTIDPSSIGRDVSEGCIRLHNKDVEELYDMVVPGATKVTIRP
jgi:LysM repeat protein